MNLGRAEIDDYCVRIGYSGSREPTAEVLRGFVAAHTATIPFENIDVLTRPPIRLDLPSLFEKLVHNRRGGYCYEQNLLLLNVLQALGFRAVCLAARVHRSRPPGVVPPRSHMLLRVDLGDHAVVADVGFGTALTAPLALEAGREQKTLHEDFRFVPADGELDLQAKFGDVWTDLYRLSLQEQMPTDYEALNWYTSTHPNSLFARNVIAARPGPNCRYTLFNNKFTTHHVDGKAERRVLNGVKDFGEVFSSCFGITLFDSTVTEAIAALAAERASSPDFFERSRQ